ncbi:MAG TPA: hypothetical protein PKC18_05100 [Lacipirellulaceae bacterium]|nr:hypothetical protein [Lacipirellulaceae bacterium]
MFDELASLAGDADRVFDRLAQHLASAGELHRLFELRLLQERRRLGLALDRRTSLDDVDEPLRTQLETAYLAACREVGELCIEAGRLREAWMYLRPAGDKAALRARLARVVLTDEQADELIELSLFEGVDPERGFAWLVGRQGTCSAITTLDGLEPQLAVDDVRTCAAVLVRHAYRELAGNLRGHWARLGGSAPASAGVRQLVCDHPELQAGGSYHLDPSHLASAMRYGRLLHDGAVIELALELAEYGARLPAELQYPGEPPFEDLYAAHQRLFAALLGRDVDEALAYFGDKARVAPSAGESSPALEAYVTLLARTGRPGEALAAYAELASPQQNFSRYAPTLLELAHQSGDWPTYAAICRDRDDLLGFAAGLVAGR